MWRFILFYFILFVFIFFVYSPIFAHKSSYIVSSNYYFVNDMTNILLCV